MNSINTAVPALTALNAIKLSARQVAQTFIAPTAYKLLVNSDNAILSGPRGSGKTTLLKMLTSEGLENWKHASGGTARNQVRNVGVFVGTDRTWSEQLTFNDESIDIPTRRRLAWAAFGTHTFKGLIDAMAYRVSGPEAGIIARHLRVELGEEQERDLSVSLSRIWRFDYRASSLSGLSGMLAERLVELGTLRRRLSAGVEATLPWWIDLDVIPAADAAVEAFNRAAGEPDQKWALLFDELELAPADLVRDLLGALRGHQPRLIFKLSLAPANDVLTAFEGVNAPVPGQDYEHIPLTHARKTASLQFARALVWETLSDLAGAEIEPIELLLGRGLLDSADEFHESADDTYSDSSRRVDPYAIGSPLWDRLRDLAARDHTFREYLTTNRINLTNLAELTPVRRASRLRKIRNIVVVREYFRNEQGRRRSRKSYALYSGADNILSLPDGNPRLLIALARQLFSSASQGSKIGRVPPPMQGRAIEGTLDRFLPLLEAQEAVSIDGQPYSLVEFLDKVGEALAKRVVEDRFNDNVRLTFYFDRRLKPEVEGLIRTGVNTGALVYVPDQNGDDQLHGAFLAKKFRLSHLLATRYGLPIHLTPSAPLSALVPRQLVNRDAPRPRRRPTTQPQPPNQDALMAQEG